MTTWAEAAEQMIAVVGKLSALQGELSEWTAGTVAGGPHGNGDYPFTQPDTTVVFIPCPAKLLFAHGDPTAALAELQDYAERAEAAAAIAESFPETFENHHSLAADDEAIFCLVNALGYQIGVIRGDLSLELPGLHIGAVGQEGSISFGDPALGTGFQLLTSLGYEYFAADPDDGIRMPGGGWRANPNGDFEIVDRQGNVVIQGGHKELALLGQTIVTTDRAMFAVVNDLGYAPLYIDLDGSGGGGSAPEEDPDPADIGMVMGDELFLVSDRPLQLYPENLWRSRGDDPVAVTSIESARGAPYPPLAVTSQSGALALPPGSLASSATLTVRPIGGRTTHYRKPLNVSVRTVPASGSARVMFIGDSITNRQAPVVAKVLLEAWGFTPTFVGTMRGNSLGSTIGPLNEGREGWSLTDYLLTLLDTNVVTSVVAAGDEAAYLAKSDANKRLAHPFLNPNLSAGSACPVVTYAGTSYRFDLRYYLTRFSLADPDIVVVNLGMNDSLKRGAINGLADVQAAYPILLDEIRRCLPSAKILVWATVLPANDLTDLNWSGRWHPVLSTIASIIRQRRLTDPNLHLCSAWIHQSAEVGWVMQVDDTDAATGVETAVPGDVVHPAGASRSQSLEAVAAAVANLF